MSRIAVLYPTTGRAEQARANIALIRQTRTAGHRLMVVMSVPEDDAATLAVARALSHEPSPVVVLYTVRQAGTTAVEGWNQAYRLARVHEADWYTLGADDVQFDPLWLIEALATCASAQTQVIGLNDGHTNLDDYAPHYMASRAFCEDVLGGHIAPPEYRSWWFDREVCERARAMGVYVPAWDAHATHCHPDWGTAAMDDTYSAAWQLHDIDRHLYEARKERGYARVFV